MIVAVNAYDESRDRIEQYMRENSLDYPVLLQGSRVARDRYFVSAFPAQF